MDSLKSLFFGDPKSNAFDTQKLKAEIDSAFNIIEEFLNLRYELTSQGIHITCHNCAKKQKIQNPKNALYVATQRDTSASLKYSSHSYKVNHSRESQSDSSVDRYQHKVARSNQVHALNYPVQTEGDDSDDDAKTDETSDKIDKDKQLLNDKLTEKEKCLREAKEENSELQKQLKEFVRKYDRDLHNAGIEQSRLTEERDRSEKSIKEIESKLNQLEFEVSDLKEELDKKKQECKHHQSCLENDKRTHETILSQMNTEQDNLRSQLREARALIETLKSRKSELSKRCDEKEEEIRKLSTQLSSLSNECRDKEKLRNSLEKKIKEIQTDNESKTEQIEKKKEEVQNLHRTRRQKEEEIGSLEKKIKDSQADNESKAEQIEKLENKIQSLHQTRRQKEQEIEKLKEEIEISHRTRREKVEEISMLEDKMTDLLNDNNSKDKHIEFVSAELRTMQRIIDDERKENKSIKASLEEEILGLKADLTAWEERTKKTLAINFHTSLKQSLALPARQHIEHFLKERCQSEKVTLEVKQYKSPDTTPGPILVLCMNVSRLGTDVKEALKGTPGNFEVLVVVLHHKEVHALPSQASDRVLTGEEYKQLGAIVDAAFWTGKGMYDCELNKLAIEKIYNFVSGFVSR